MAISCRCGNLIGVDLRDGYLVTPGAEKVWLRRRSDEYKCPQCWTSYAFIDLSRLVALSHEGEEEPARDLNVEA